MSRLVVENLSIRFGGLLAVEDVSFSVEPGEIFAVIGPNGAGKSTVFNLISRLYEPSGGAIRYGDADLLRYRAHQITGLGVARTFQNIELFENATVLDNLLVGRHHRMRRNLLREMIFPPAQRREEHDARLKVEQVIDLLDLAHLRYERIRDLPYGARKNVEIARALCSEPSLLLLDEPASGLNHEETDDLAFWLEDIRADLGVTLVMVEHDMGLVNRMADRVLALHNGRVLALGSPEEVRGHPAVQEAYLGGVA
ncbi:ABC transporter ATP-binding protein [Oceanibacterium hippocampi]|uniref:Sulfate/thiosulfate import ATP-binding protein CysA n=1 Tax=Oceanibacterium hippocampi TaxID=745714 RepID=A0A1Y5SUC7_9PROT|nr:ABC transporter ATP-binding protein [Oceanibacterium hippocampi]SLN46687.1 Sulfate/thiosulfate import ATP-binding protein CysA [Oceanibacterium hippocampi]